MTTTQHPTLRYKTALTVGFLCVTTAIAAAYRRPATGYELSIYASTPPLFWAGVAAGVLAGAAVVLTAPGRSALTTAGLALASLSVLAVVALPTLRSYHFYGAGDSLTHLGWAREIRLGVLDPVEFLYPGVHLLATFMEGVAGVGLPRALVVVPTVLFPIASVVFFGLVVSTVSESRWGLPVGVLVGLLFVPINAVSVHTITHPSSQTILFLPVALYLLFRYVTSDAEGFPLATGDGLLFAIVCVGIVLLHPQEAMSFLAVLVAIYLAQTVVGRLDPYHPIAEHRSVGVHTLLTAVTFFAWTARIERAQTRFLFTVQSFLGQTGETLGEASERGASLAYLGGSIEELFVKLFAVTVVFCLLAAAVVVVGYRDRFRGASTSDPAVAYLAAGLVPLSLGFLVVFFAEQGDHYFRLLGSIMVLVSVLGGIAMARGMTGLDRRATRAQLATVVGVVFVAFLVLQLLTVHASPYIYQGNQQVPEQTMAGHETALEHHDGRTPLLGIRGGQIRYVHAHYGTTTAEAMEFPGLRDSVSEEAFQGGAAAYDDDRYVVLTEADRQRETGLYDGLRYTEAGFQQFERDPGIYRVQDNGEFQLYRVDPA